MEGLQNHASLVGPPPISWEELLSNGRVENGIFIFAVFSKNGDSDKKNLTFPDPTNLQVQKFKVQLPHQIICWNWYGIGVLKS